MTKSTGKLKRIKKGGKGKLARVQELSRASQTRKIDVKVAGRYQNSLRPSPVLVGRPRGCQFPLWPHSADKHHPDFGRVYCGEKVTYQSYCEHHAKMCWHAPPAKTGKPFVGITR